MNNIPSAEEILNILIPQKENVSKEENEDSLKQNIEVLKDWSKLHLEAQLKAILKNVKTKEDYSFCGNTGSEYPPDTIVDRDSIINAYDLNNIK